MTPTACFSYAWDRALRQVGDPVDVVTGAQSFFETDFRLQGDFLPFSWVSHYDSRRPTVDRGVGPGFRLSIDLELRFDLDGITFVNGEGVWFTETMGNKIGRITPTGEITELALPTPKSNPEGITIGSDGNLWFAEVGKNAIGSMRLTGELLTEYVIPLIAKADAVNGQPSGIALGPDGNF